MITYKSDNCKFHKNINTENIEKFSKILEITNINKTNIPNNNDILHHIKDYEIYVSINDFSNLLCPLCKHKGFLLHHKDYKRNIIFNINNFEINAILSITVLECSYCKKNFKDKQHFHSLLPIFVLPYHIYSEDIIIDTLYDRIVRRQKIKYIIEKRNISHQLFYKWLRGLKLYSISSSTIMETKNNLTNLITCISKDSFSFLYQFFYKYFHPFFLFKTTCVPLVIKC